MKKIIYKGIDTNGAEKKGFVSASSNAEALQLLKARGLADVQLYDDVLFAQDRAELENLSDAALEAIAKFEINVRSKPRLLTFLLEVLRVNKLIVLGGLGLCLWGWYSGSYLSIIFGALISLSMPALSLWNYRHVSNYTHLLRTCADGRWGEANRLIENLRGHMKAPMMAFDLDIRKACIEAHVGSLNTALAIVEKWKHSFNEESPGLYESRVASIYHACDRYDDFIDQMRDAYFKSSLSPTLIVDLALAEARLGDVNKAEKLLACVRIEELPSHGLPFVDWIKGVVAKRKQDPQAQKHLEAAVSGMLQFGENPAIWTSLAVCVGCYAAALPEPGAMEKAQSLLASVAKILKVHGDKPLLAELTEKYPNWSS